MPTRKRTINYLRAHWPPLDPPAENDAVSLESILRKCLNQMTSVESTELDFKGGKAAVRHRQTNQTGIYLHVATWTEKENASTVPHDNTQAGNADLGAAPPDPNWDYLDGDGMVLLSGNHCLIMPSGIRRDAVGLYLQLLIDHAQQHNNEIDIPDNASSFQLIQIVRSDLAQQISREGLKHITFLDVAQYWTTAKKQTDD